jgi:hypothetical protein
MKHFGYFSQAFSVTLLPVENFASRPFFKHLFDNGTNTLKPFFAVAAGKKIPREKIEN